MKKEDDPCDIDTLLSRIDEEQQKNLSLNHLNMTLREQLDQATSANQRLTQELQKVNGEWLRLKEQFEAREREWREEENSFNDYFGQEHAKLLTLWRTVVSFRRNCGDLKSTTEKDLNRLKLDLNQASRNMQTACYNFNASLRSSESQGQVNITTTTTKFF